MTINELSLDRHRQVKGKIETGLKVSVNNRDDLSLVYTPGVAAVAAEIGKNPEAVWDLTIKSNTVAVVTDGSAILGLGNLGARAALPVMEGKAVLFKKLAGVNAFPICLETQDPDAIVEAVKNIAPVFGGINLEDIAAPKCFEIEARLWRELDIPVMHDDQHGTAIVVLAALTNALRIVGKNIGNARIILCGAGAAGLTIGNTLIDAGAGDVTLVDSHGVISADRAEGMNEYKKRFAERAGVARQGGLSLAQALVDADVFIGVSRPGILTAEMIAVMNPDPIIFAMSNPTPEIMPDIAQAAGAAVVATGRSDFGNQVNNALAFPGVFLGLLEARAKKFDPGIKAAAASAIANLVPNPTPDKILPDLLEPGLARAVADAVKSALPV